MDPRSYRPNTSDIPTKPGVYRFYDAYDRVIYVGKAKNIRARLQNYFQPLESLHPRTKKMVLSAVDLQWTVVSSELEAITLEYTWIKEYDPYFNIMFRDDKSYPYIAVSVSEEYPRIFYTRAQHNKKYQYYGPFTKPGAAKESITELISYYRVRSCTNAVFNQHKRLGRPCLYGYIDSCFAPCVSRVSHADYRHQVAELCKFIAGKDDSVIQRLEEKMKQAASVQEYEKAAKLRDSQLALMKVLEKNTVVLDENIDVDVIGTASDDIEMSVQIFYVRAGRIRGQQGWIGQKRDDSADTAALAACIEQLYGERIFTHQEQALLAARSVDDKIHKSLYTITREIWVPDMPDNSEILCAWLAKQRAGKVDFVVPKRGPKKAILDLVSQNAEQALSQHKAKRAGDITARGAALAQLQAVLEIAQVPLRIECYDISHTQGNQQVASMVVFEDGLPRKNQYRYFNILHNSDTGKSDDVAAMQEVIKRRFTRFLAESQGKTGVDDEGVRFETDLRNERGKPKSFSYKPQLVVVDGGMPQVNAAREVLDEIGIFDLPVVGIAKRLEEVWIPGVEFPVIMGRSDPGIFLLQHIRDESHRFAITQHRKRRSKAMLRSVLDEVPGLGVQKQVELLRYFGSVNKIRLATVEQLQQVKGIGEKLAQSIYDFFQNSQ